MSNLIKPYEIAVYDDVFESGNFVEKRLGIIGTNEMDSLNRALEPNLVRNVNGQNKFSFKMYKYYTDTVTGEKTYNPFVDWLISERKVKLKYGKYIDSDGSEKDRWYDFIIKDINENSATYLYTYQLEDANVQELSKNGFGITLDAKLNNNIGDAATLGQFVMAETDWTVDGDVVVETIDEALVYVTLPSSLTNYKIYHLVDQVYPYNNGVTGDTTPLTGENLTSLQGKTVLAFYSSCKNKPHRFQFIYVPEKYSNTSPVGYDLNKKDDRTIVEKDCQYFIEFDDPETTYKAPNSTQNTDKYDLYLPNDFDVNVITGNNNDTTISSWYRGARYSYAQQSEYVPLLDKYCSKYTQPTTNVSLTDKLVLHYEGSQGGISKTGEVYTKNAKHSGIKLNTTYTNGVTYLLSYQLEINGGTLYNIGGHNSSFKTFYEVYEVNGSQETKIGETVTDTFVISESGITTFKTYKVYAKYYKINAKDDTPYLFIQPNKGRTDSVSFTISNLSLKTGADHYGYIDTEYVSPTLIRNYINNPKFDSTAGWTITGTSRETIGADQPSLTNTYGRFITNSDSSVVYRSMMDDFLNNDYDEDNTYDPYLQLTFTNNGQFLLNSGLRDNRTTIENLHQGQELVVDYQILDSSGNIISGSGTNDPFAVSIGEYIYSVDSGGYSYKNENIVFDTGTAAESSKPGITRKIFKVSSTSYTKDTFKKECKLYLNFTINKSFLDGNNDGKNDPQVYYLKHIALYNKVLNDNSKIIEPDYDESKSEAASLFANDGILQKKYNYFPKWLLDTNNITDAESIPLVTKDALKYDEFIPVYNTGARKIRTVSVQESNYFNILQTIAETFEQWLDIDISRDNYGAITDKKIHFRNYSGDDNYACFRYGVNLKDIQRTYSSKNIATKLIVKPNMNEHGKDGFCTIQRAGANPTGENYIYDFQYYQDTGIMPVDEFLDTCYYIDGAYGPDNPLWTKEEEAEGEEEEEIVQIPTSSNPTNIKGYYPRIKKINDSLLPINTQLAGAKADLVQLESKEEVAKASYEAAISGIEQVRGDFKALTGIYPEDAQDGEIASISVESLTPQNSWFEVPTKADGTLNYTIADTNVLTVPIVCLASDKQVYPTTKFSTGLQVEKTISNYAYKITKTGEANTEYEGIYIDYDYVEAQSSTGGGTTSAETYRLEYKLTLNSSSIEGKNSTLKNIGCHNHGAFKHDDDKTKAFIEIKKVAVDGTITKFSPLYYKDITFDANNRSSVNIVGLDKDKDGNSVTNNVGDVFYVTLFGTYDKSDENAYFWIQPNRGIIDAVTCTISDVKMYVVNGQSAAASTKRTAVVDASVKIALKNTSTQVVRKYSLEINVPVGETGADKGSGYPLKTTQVITAVDADRSDVRKYLNEYTTYYETRESSSKDKTDLASRISTKKATITNLEETQKRYLDWKQELNQLFFKRYSRFIQEGTWIGEEYVDDEKYYADALSVLYNSCYPQVSYNINVMELSQLPGYEMFKFELGDRTWAIDDEFFGEDHKEEVILTELSETLDDPSKNSAKVQNFKNQFQDLFQKITATTLQAQYNTGAYKKGSALVDANEAKKSEFITKAINEAAAFLAPGKTHTVTWEGGNGITVTDETTPTNQVRIVGGAILLSTEDPTTKQQTWITGVTNKGISANLITAGKLKTSEIQIMSGDEPTFRWDAYGISAYDATWFTEGTISTISGINSKKFVRFDKYGVYGMNNSGIDGANWHPSSINDIDDKATFALTWEGLKVTGDDGIVARIGYSDNIVDGGGNITTYGNILNITDASQNSLMSFSNNGVLKVGEWSVSQNGLESIDSEDNNTETPVTYRMTRNAPSRIETSKVFLSSKGRQASFYKDANNIDTNLSNVVFKAGDRFMVTDEGVLYASAGQIGTMQIGDIASKDEVNTAKNEAISTAEGKAQGFVDALREDVENLGTNLQSQIDGNISTYFLPYLPTVNRYPVINGTTNDGPGNGQTGWNGKYAEHNGDLFYVTSPNGEVFTQTAEPNKVEGIYWIHPDDNQEIIIQKCVVTSANNPTLKWETLATDSDEAKIVEKIGYCYRWQYTDLENKTTPENNWVLITDTAIAEALADAAKAQKTADGKMAVYNTATNISPEEGDLLIPTQNEGNYKASRVYKYTNNTWVEINYTDNSVNTNNFSWEFSPQNGMFMWDGVQHKANDKISGSTSTYGATRGAIFAIYQDGNNKKLYMKGNGEFTGKIIATDGEFTGKIVADSGNIAGFSISNESYSNSLSATGGTRPILRYITNTLQTAYEESYNGVPFGRIELISRDGDKSKVRYTTKMSSNRMECFTTNDEGNYQLITRIEPGRIEMGRYGTANGDRDNFISLSHGYSLKGDNTISTSTAYFTFGKSFTAGHITFDGQEISGKSTNDGFYISNNHGDISLRVNTGSGDKTVKVSELVGLKARVDDLGFKKGYIWSNSGDNPAVMGVVAQLGTAVYGCIYNDVINEGGNYESGAPTREGIKFSSSKDSDLGDMTFPAPSASDTIVVYGSDWYGEYEISSYNNGGSNILKINLKSYKDDKVSVPCAHYGFFCYNTKAEYDL